MKKVLWTLVCVMVGLTARAQYDAAFTNYWALQSYFNPAASGLAGQLNIQGAYSLQLLGFENAPSTMLATADMPLFFIGPRHGVGAGFMNDDIGLWSNKKFYIQYAYHQPLWGGNLSIGVRPGFLTDSFDGSDVDLGQTGDPAFPTSQVSGNAFDLDAGVRYTYKKIWYVGMSAMHCMAPTIRLGDDKNNEISISPLLCMTGGYNIKFRAPQYQLMTSAILRSDMKNWRGDVTARLGYNNEKLNMYAGLGYSPTNSVSVLIGGVFAGFKVGYSYEIYTRGVGALNGTHELVVGYQTDLNLSKKGKNLHKSVRIL